MDFTDLEHNSLAGFNLSQVYPAPTYFDDDLTDALVYSGVDMSIIEPTLLRIVPDGVELSVPILVVEMEIEVVNVENVTVTFYDANGEELGVLSVSKKMIYM